MGKGAIAIGVLLILVSVFGFFKILVAEISLFVLIYPLVGVGVGIAMIILYREEDKIEERKDLKSLKSKK